MDLWQRRPSCDYKLSFWPLAGMMMVMMIIVVPAKNYNYSRENMIIVASISKICWIWTCGNAVHLMTRNRLFGRSQG